MATPILATKLFVPPARPNAVARPRLIAQLNEGQRGKLTLLSASAGFGKTTLVSEWIAAFSSHPERWVAWLSLDAEDSDPTRFLAYLVAAVQTSQPQIGAEVVAALASSQPPRESAGRAALLTVLLNDIATLPNQLVLVLDDYHAIDATAVDEIVVYLLEHLPPQLHILITTREDPPFPLARLRARGQLTELRAADLRFSPAEAAEFLSQVMRLQLAEEEVLALEQRTEGWIAGLQLAALSMRGRTDVAGFVKAFAGDNRYIVDYLVEEVLARQPARVRNFLLQTSILDRLHGSLCDAVVGDWRLESGDFVEHQSPVSSLQSQTLLEQLEHANLFVVPLDDARQWYRYHHLFADVLATHLQTEQPGQIAKLHRRASEWYAQHAAPVEAIRHALAAQDFAWAADLIERAVPATRRNRQEATLLSWLKALPDEVIRNRPVLSVHYAGTLLQTGQSSGVAARLHDAEQWLDARAATGAIFVDEAEFRRLPGWIAIYRAGQALVHGAVSATLHYAQQALALLPEDELLGRGAASALLGLAYWTSGDLEATYQTYAEGMASLQRAGYIADAIGGTIALADIRLAQGQLRQALHIYEQALQLATAHGTPTLRGTADMYVGKSEIYREIGDLPTALQQLLKAKEQGEHTGFPQNPYRWCVAMARLCQSQGDWDGALELLQAAARLYVSDFYPNVRPVAALTARVWITQGRVAEALDWARAAGLSPKDELSYLREFEHITLARVLLARYQRDHDDDMLRAAIALLARLEQAAELGGRTGSVIEILILQALAQQLHGDIPAANLSLTRALTLAEPEGYIRIFVDEGPPMLRLLHEVAIMPAYTGRLLAAFGAVPPPRAAESSRPATLPVVQPLIEPLSERELDVLRLFKTDLSGPEIARELVVALSTIRTHTKSIYSKLNVNSRRAAVQRAVELALI